MSITMPLSLSRSLKPGFILLLSLSFLLAIFSVQAQEDTPPEPASTQEPAPLSTEPAEPPAQPIVTAEATAEATLPPLPTQEVLPTEEISPPPTSTQSNLTLAYSTNFDNGVPPELPIDDAWTVVDLGGGNRALQPGTGAAPIYYLYPLIDSAVQARFYLLSGEGRVSLRDYTAGLNASGQLTLYNGETVVTSINLTLASQTWHTLRLQIIGTWIEVSVDGVSLIITTVQGGPMAGHATVLALEGSSLRVDDFAVFGEVYATSTPQYNTATPAGTNTPVPSATPTKTSTPAPLPIVPPGNIQVTRSGNVNTVTWTDTNNAETAYQIMRYPTFGEKLLPANTTSFQDTVAVCNMTVFYRVLTYKNDSNAYSEGRYSPWFPVVTTPCAAEPAPPPACPTVAAIQRINVSWNGKYQTSHYPAHTISNNAGISYDGRYILFSAAQSLENVWQTPELNSELGGVGFDLYRFDRQTCSTLKVSIGDSENESTLPAEYGAMSDDGNLVVFGSASPNLTSEAYTGQHVFVRNINGISTERIPFTDNLLPGDLLTPRDITADGRYVLFDVVGYSSFAATTFNTRTYVYDRDTDTYLYTQTDSTYNSPGISIFTTNGKVYVLQMQNSYTLTLLNVTDNVRTELSGEHTFNTLGGVAINGTTLTFAFTANNPSPSAYVRSIDLATLQMTTATVVSRLSGVNGTILAPVYAASISADGRWVTFSTQATVYVRDLLSNTTQSVYGTSGKSTGLGFSGDGKQILFASDRSGIVSGDSNNLCETDNVTPYDFNENCNDVFITKNPFVTIVPPTPTPSMTPRPPVAAPSNLSVSVSPILRMTLRWQDNSNDETSFRVEQTYNATTTTHTIGVNGTTYAQTVPCVTTIQYRVRAHRSVDNVYSAWTDWVTITTPPCPTPTATATYWPLSAPSNLQVVLLPGVGSGASYSTPTKTPGPSVTLATATATSTANHQYMVRLTWQDNSQDESNYQRERLINTASSLVSYTANTVQADDLVMCGTTASYRVRATRSASLGGAVSEWTDWVSITVPPCDAIITELAGLTLTAAAVTPSATPQTGETTSEPTVEPSLEPTASLTASSTASVLATPSNLQVVQLPGVGHESIFSTATYTPGPNSTPVTATATITASTFYSVSLSWQDNTLDETAFQVQTFQNLTYVYHTTPANAVQFIDTLYCGASVAYRVRAYRASDNKYSAWTPWVDINMPFCGPTSTPVTGPVSPTPTNIYAFQTEQALTATAAMYQMTAQGATATVLAQQSATAAAQVTASATPHTGETTSEPTLEPPLPTATMSMTPTNTNVPPPASFNCALVSVSLVSFSGQNTLYAELRNNNELDTQYLSASLVWNYARLRHATTGSPSAFAGFVSIDNEVNWTGYQSEADEPTLANPVNTTSTLQGDSFLDDDPANANDVYIPDINVLIPAGGMSRWQLTYLALIKPLSQSMDLWEWAGTTLTIANPTTGVPCVIPLDVPANPNPPTATPTNTVGWETRQALTATAYANMTATWLPTTNALTATAAMYQMTATAAAQGATATLLAQQSATASARESATATVLHPVTLTALAQLSATATPQIGETTSEPTVEVTPSATPTVFLPAAPTLMLPANNTLMSDRYPAFRWNVGAGITWYDLQVAHSADFTVLLHEKTQITGTLPGDGSVFARVDGLLPQGSFWWRVRARTNSDQVSPWSEARQFEINVAERPANNAVIVANTGSATPEIRFVWNEMHTGDESYRLEAASDAAFTSIITTCVQDFANCAHLLPVGTYYWRVGIISDAGVNWPLSGYTFTISQGAPAVVKPVTPPNGAVVAGTQSSSGILSWGWQTLPESTVGFTYEVEVDTASTFDTPSLLPLLELAETSVTLPFLPDGTYFWRVRALNANDIPGPWSAVWRFTVDATPPAAPVLTQPTENMLYSSPRPTFKWTPVQGAAGYDVALAYAGETCYDSPMFWRATTSATYTMPSPWPQDAFMVCVRAFDAVGNYGEFSAPRTFRIFLGTQPLDGAFISATTRPVFRWAAAPGVNGEIIKYTVQIDNDDDLSNGLQHTSPELSVNTTAYTMPGLLPAGVYRWRVIRVGNWYDENLRVPEWRTLIIGGLTTGPTLLAPVQNQVINGPVSLAWDAATAPTGTTIDSYEVVISRSASFSSALSLSQIVSDLSLNHTPLDNQNRVTYYWRVRGLWDGLPVTTWSARSFVVDNVGPVAPVINAPINNALLNVVRPTITWASVPTAINYTIGITDAATGTELMDERIVTGNSYKPDFNLPQGPITIRVRANDSINTSGWTYSSVNIRLGTLPSQNSIVNTARPTFTWTPVIGAAGYTLQIDNDSFFDDVGSGGDGAIYRTINLGTVTSYTLKTNEQLTEQGMSYYWRLMPSNGAYPYGTASRVFYRAVAAALKPSGLESSVDTENALASANYNTAAGLITLRWNGITPSPLQYEIQIGTSAAFGTVGLVQRFSTDPTIVIDPTQLAEGLKYWRVRGLYSADSTSYGPWSDAQTFTIDRTPPPAPMINGALTSTISTLRPTFKWFPSIGASHYVLYVFDESTAGLVPGLDGVTVKTTSYTALTPLNQNNTAGYRWSVHAIDAAGNISGAGLNPIVSLFSGITPAKGQLVTALAPTFQWTPVTGLSAAPWVLEIARNAQMTDIVYSSPAPLAATATRFTLPAVSALTSGTYYWRVYRTNEDASTIQGQAFSVGAVASLTPHLLIPVNASALNAEQLAAGPVFTWAAQKPGTPSTNAAVQSYRFELAKAATFTPSSMVFTENVSGVSSLTLPQLSLSDGMYYWRVQARYAADVVGPYSTPFTVRIDKTPPTRPILLLPVSRALVFNTPGPTLTWTTSTEASSYVIEVALDEGFTNLRLTQTVSSLTRSLIVPTLPNGSYFWRVSANDAVGNLNITSARRFTIAVP